jgi:hypothetical protein
MGNVEAGEVRAKVEGGGEVRTDPTDPAVHAFLPYVRLNSVMKDGRSYLCGGTIVHAWEARDEWLAGFWVITAAHCIKPESRLTQVRVWAGTGAEPGEPIVYDSPGWATYGGILSRVYVHPRYNATFQQGDNPWDFLQSVDLALIRVLLPYGANLPENVLKSVPVIADAYHARNWSDHAGETFTTVGFGGDTRSLRAARLTAATNILQGWSVHSESVTFAEGGAQEGQVRPGDSGGPVFEGDSAQALVAVYSARWTQTLPLFSDAQVATALGTFLGPDETLPRSSSWRAGIYGLVNRHSPVNMPTPTTNDTAPNGNKMRLLPGEINGTVYAELPTGEAARGVPTFVIILIVLSSFMLVALAAAMYYYFTNSMRRLELRELRQLGVYAPVPAAEPPSAPAAPPPRQLPQPADIETALQGPQSPVRDPLEGMPAEMRFRGAALPA